MNALLQLQRFSHNRLSWALLFIFVLFFELCALYFQHIMMLSPCVMCIYERIAMLGIGVGAFIGLLNPKQRGLRWSGFIVWGISAYQGLTLSIEHVDYQLNPSPFNTCDLFVTFPDWAPLNQWVPWMFEAYGDCSDISWQFITLTMPQWLVVIFVGNLIALAAVLVAQCLKRAA
ncbi:disulfide bond formation protein DsbB [Vibrio sp. V27_P1S3P104]|uniref:disulfide bond formation protein DsbB n=1 Tax=unclassified Vibrio TaxID=2614977 RepID=UPI0013728AE8|nr:disulfide bond formation protein DsbB [Vibrio sp. V28_P6S34P95]NAX04424.1 disulfide bond formation protein DsbB [Vibrio sp. V30_P3S12P165]NAX34069.1 disulfide bond formation protein DsbB [Vibrio sp. V29_P1S30P107]NAX38177.1 disulfide bond formation protein DsbB [Vibrio sp. V27_P1S3P104]NAX39618.1 disulfide bond formation protein DsbB [Vibrio sp. V26_P1S5P106]